MIRLIKMTESEFKTYLEKAVQDYAVDKAQSGDWPKEDALELSRKSYQDLLPQGVNTRHNYLFTIQSEETGEEIGVIWIKHEAPRPYGFIFDIVLDEAERGKGYGKQAMLAIETVAKDLGIEAIGLHVFSHNPTATHLYRKLGYEVTSQNMVKRLKD